MSGSSIDNLDVTLKFVNEYKKLGYLELAEGDAYRLTLSGMEKAVEYIRKIYIEEKMYEGALMSLDEDFKLFIQFILEEKTPIGVLIEIYKLENNIPF